MHTIHCCAFIFSSPLLWSQCFLDHPSGLTFTPWLQDAFVVTYLEIGWDLPIKCTMVSPVTHSDFCFMSRHPLGPWASWEQRACVFLHAELASSSEHTMYFLFLQQGNADVRSTKKMDSRLSLHFCKNSLLRTGGGEGRGSLACCSPWGRKELDTTERLNSNKEYRQLRVLKGT